MKKYGGVPQSTADSQAVLAKGRYETFNHTADLGLRVFGRTREELFANAGYAMFDILTDLKNVQAKETLKIKQEAPNLEELFLSWLSELLYQYNGKEMIFKKFAIDKLTDQAISARAQGEKVDLERHRLKTEIKAVTYHELKVQKLTVKHGETHSQRQCRRQPKQCSTLTCHRQYWQGQVIFDV
ncbi:archease [candidate division NPL-UPA2 bacterium]|nr:archease [candidate division NPL-UPA2 bacterium]